MIIINCKNKIIGRISSVIVKILINFYFLKKTINIFFININEILIKKYFYKSHSGYIGNLKLSFKKKIFFLKKSIYRMLPKNKIRKKIMKKIFFLQ
ncbi:uL13 family ribosomal protein [Candidatus Carsonella ruddii]|uniref:Putative ribosomal protein L13 n=1 Tax=Candidatus Carsonella ruddii HC isolate Thao2000 TaxID=1202538 RepID=J3TE78_CARRU|nr:uL13 family ribosomal protein [Candidatus Carsonella ruddii]AFP83907.1 putative ribosomal protein L13 [Candidatus Carsonella ruddii HC isolate Thao2000]